MSRQPTKLARAIRLATPVLPLSIALLGFMPSLVNAQTTSAIRGSVTAPDGAAAANTQVIITDTRTRVARNYTTNDAGAFNARGLPVGGPYTITVDSNTYTDQSISDIFLNLGDTYNFEVALQSSAMETVVITATALNKAAMAMGPSSSFNLSDLQSMPNINRDIKDVLRIDPRIYIDEGFVDGVQCAGASARFNSLTVDSVRMNDNFGVNNNGYPTERMPFSYDAIQQIAVELAPFDVQYGGFSACNINAVTKSGTNEFHGSAFYDYTSNDWQGDELEGTPIRIDDFDEDRFGGFLGGPIIPDKLFFFLSYEELSGAQTFDRGPAGTNAGRPIQGVSPAQLDQIAVAAKSVYGYDPGGFPTSLPVEDQKYLAKLDWQINDSHSASLIYNYNDGFSIAQADNDTSSIEFANHFYERGAELESYVAQVFSDWSDNFSTEFRIGHTELDNRQLSLAGTEFGEFQITTLNDHDGDGVNSRATVYLGADDSRHANKLTYESDNFRLAGTYSWGDHVFSGGYEQEKLDVFNLFIQETEGEFRFNSIADFIAGKPSLVIYENAAPSNIKENGAARFGYQINSIYLQDEFLLLSGDVSIVAGLRYDWYESDDVPRLNPNVARRYGFSNQQNFDGLDLVQPRVGFEWSALDNLSVHGGVGLYSGGNPNVWLSNNYSNDGVTQVERQLRNLNTSATETLFNIPTVGGGKPGFAVPQTLFDQVANGVADSGVNVLDPNFKVPKSWKYALGAVYDFSVPGLDDDYRLTADYLLSETENAAIVTDLTLTNVGTAPDGRPIYRGIDRGDADCATSPTGSACTGRTTDFMLTNVKGEDAYQESVSLGINKQYDFGLSWALAYAWNESKDVSPMTSSVAFSNYANIAVSDPNNPQLATSNYEIPNRFTFRLAFEKAFFGDNLTKISLFGSHNEGRPYSFTYTSSAMFGDSISTTPGRALLYVPAGTDDPKVRYGANFNKDAFFRLIGQYGLQPGIMPRNSLQSDWLTKFDLRIDQEFPGFMEGNKLAAFFVIENVGNLLNDDWGVMYEATFPQYQAVVNGTIDAATGQYVYNEFFQANPQGRVTKASLWELRMGFRYEF
jgi:hypothetical protein